LPALINPSLKVSFVVLTRRLDMSGRRRSLLGETGVIYNGRFISVNRDYIRHRGSHHGQDAEIRQYVMK
jgi:hypothetical protein